LSGASGASAIIADPGAPKNQQPTIVNTANGLPQVNIQTPSAAGVSRNSYKQFDIDSRGVILNNSRTNASTRQGGWVQGNPWLGKGTAKIIVNEVNSNQPSQLRGFVEVAGDRAQVVIANPSGISCAGCGFINADRATLSTGRPLYGTGGGLSGFQVENGLIRVDGAGLDASQTSHTAILARAVEINAGLWAQYLSVVTGQNQVAADGETATASPGAAATDKPRFALDTARLGGMYAGKIFLIGTEAGVGMRHAGQIGAGPGGFVLRHDGRLELTGGLSSEGDARLASRELEQRGTLYSSGALTVDAGQSLHNSGLLAAHGDVSASAVQLDNRGTLAAGLNGSGDIDRAAALTLSGQTLDLSGGTLNAGGHASLEAGGRIDHRAARLQAGTLRLRAGDAIDNRDGQLAAQQDLALESGSLDNQHGRIGSLGGLNTRVRGGLDNRSGQLAADGQARVDAGHVDNHSGALGSAHGGLALGIGTLDNDGGQVLATGDLSLTLSGDYLHRGELQAGRDLTLASPGTIDNQGRIGAGQTLTLGAATLFNRRSGELVAGGGSRLNLSGELDNAGLIDS
ncbi:MAG: filamentous hemagglutinin N-terminal domain-containing protein, partial [Microvirgula sp.]